MNGYQRGVVLAGVRLDKVNLVRLQRQRIQDDCEDIRRIEKLPKIQRGLGACCPRISLEGSGEEETTITGMKLTLVFGYQSPVTSGLSSRRRWVQHWARDLPRQDSSRKKLTPRSASLTMASSAMVNLPMPVEAWWLATRARTHGPTNASTWTGWHGWGTNQGERGS